MLEYELKEANKCVIRDPELCQISPVPGKCYK